MGVPLSPKARQWKRLSKIATPARNRSPRDLGHLGTYPACATRQHQGRYIDPSTKKAYRWWRFAPSTAFPGTAKADPTAKCFVPLRAQAARLSRIIRPIETASTSAARFSSVRGYFFIPLDKACKKRPFVPYQFVPHSISSVCLANFGDRPLRLVSSTFLRGHSYFHHGTCSKIATFPSYIVSLLTPGPRASVCMSPP